MVFVPPTPMTLPVSLFVGFVICLTKFRVSGDHNRSIKITDIVTYLPVRSLQNELNLFVFSRSKRVTYRLNLVVLSLNTGELVKETKCLGLGKFSSPPTQENSFRRNPSVFNIRQQGSIGVF